MGHKSINATNFVNLQKNKCACGFESITVLEHVTKVHKAVEVHLHSFTSLELNDGEVLSRQSLLKSIY
jgi:hypothetical protein